MKIVEMIEGRVCVMFSRFIDKAGKAWPKDKMIAIFNKNYKMWNSHEKKTAKLAINLAMSNRYRLIEPDYVHSSFPRLILIGSKAEELYNVSHDDDLENYFKDSDLIPKEKSPGEIVVEDAEKDLIEKKWAGKAFKEKMSDKKAGLPVMSEAEADVVTKPSRVIEDDADGPDDKGLEVSVLESGSKKMAAKLRAKGMNYNQIAKEMGTTREVVSLLFKGNK